MLKISAIDKTNKNNNKVIALDFDGVLHSYTQGWTGDIPEDPPVDGSLQFVEDLKSLGYKVVIHSTRKPKYIKKWLKENGFPDIEVCVEKPKAKLYVDDRGFRFDGDFTKVISFIKNDTSPWHDPGRDQ